MAITADVSSQLVDRVHELLSWKFPALVNRQKAAILQHGNENQNQSPNTIFRMRDDHTLHTRRI